MPIVNKSLWHHGTRVLPFPHSSVNTPAQTAVGGTAGSILMANDQRGRLKIQNTGTTIIYIALGTVNPTVTVYHTALAACTIANDGTGGILIDDGWTGEVRAIGSGAGGSVVIEETSY